ncbi:MAG: hypothetical protein HYV63_05615 [Candidatus Schekmanbacteria bacterium]|nr:hypothetical protein [Candidatus Schekmanbacteria bacterium]
MHVLVTDHFHRVYGLSLRSNVALAGIPVEHDVSNDAAVRVWWRPCEVPDLSSPAWRVIRRPAHATQPQASKNRRGDRALSWGRHLVLLYDSAGTAIRMSSVCPDKLTAALVVLQGIGLGYCLRLRQVLCMHGAVVERDGAAIALLGLAGAGKSTLAASLIQRGFALVADDLVVLERHGDDVVVPPGYPALRLAGDALAELSLPADHLRVVPWTNKHYWDVSAAGSDRICARAVPLAAMYVLCPADDAEPAAVTPVGGPAALAMLCAAQYPPDMPHLLTPQQVELCAHIVRTLPIHALRGTPIWQQRPALTELLVRHVDAVLCRGAVRGGRQP